MKHESASIHEMFDSSSPFRGAFRSRSVDIRTSAAWRASRRLLGQFESVSLGAA